MRFAQLPGVSINDCDGVAGIVDEQLLAGAVSLAHDEIDAPSPDTITLAEPTVLKPVGVRGFVLVPQQRQGDAFAPQLSVHLCQIGQWHG